MPALEGLNTLLIGLGIYCIVMWIFLFVCVVFEDWWVKRRIRKAEHLNRMLRRAQGETEIQCFGDSPPNRTR